MNEEKFESYNARVKFCTGLPSILQCISDNISIHMSTHGR